MVTRTTGEPSAGALLVVGRTTSGPRIAGPSRSRTGAEAGEREGAGGAPLFRPEQLGGHRLLSLPSQGNHRHRLYRCETTVPAIYAMS